MPHSNLVPALLVPLFAWRLYRRVRRNVGRQPVRNTRMIMYMIILGLVSAGVITLSHRNPQALVGVAGGLVIGFAVGLVALHFTRYEITAEGPFYTPNPYIGVAISLLLVGRVVYRLSLLYTTGASHQGEPSLDLSPVTVGILEILAGYYWTYYAGILIQLRREKKLAE